MALNLISSYDSDGSSSVSDGDGPVRSSEVETPQSSEKPKNSSFFFGGDSSDDDTAGSSKNADVAKLTPSSGAVRRLPSAGAVLTGKHVGSSVFSSEREREDLAHALTLSQHVPLTEKVETKKKPLCRAFARGHCRRGDRCRYAHPVTQEPVQNPVTIDAAPKMYEADDIFAKKPKIA
ncbi:hypothetical protein COOONC_11390 [Cooperia oncophora]